MFARLGLLLITALTLAASAATVRAADPEEGFIWMFDGKSLEGWDGDPKFWSVGDGGAITGRTTAENPTKGNTFLIYRKAEVADFEFRCEFKIIGGNSGIQYRSEEVAKWVIKGYQADFDAGGGWTGSLYEEKGRGILAKRGNKVLVPAGGKPENKESIVTEKEVVDSVKKEDWNSYTILAEGNHLIQKVNGITTVDLVDEDDKAGKKSGLLALQLHAGPPMTVEFRNIRIRHIKSAKPVEKVSKRLAPPAGEGKKIVFVAGKPSHGYGAHEHNAGCILLAKELEKALPNYKTVVYRNGWPTEAGAFDGANAIIMYCDGGGGHMVNAHLEEVDALAKKGVGIVCIHYGVEVPADPAGKKFLEWIGGYFEANWSVNPHWTPKFDKLPEHAITRGVKPFSINDEWYYHMRFRPELQGVTPILSALPGPDTLTRPDGAHSGNPNVRKAVAAGEIQHMAWASENAGGGRGFGFTGGHDHWNWGCPDFLKIVLNAIVWTAHGEVPAEGVVAPTVTLAELEKNQDYPAPANFNRETVIKKINAAGGKADGE
ncbi:MAG: DUF1080 domain-containing protein [Planctomycetia bacterium]|nr:DUF1080 domain-containing protein [Planctomycetia bacterium]